MTHTIYLWCLPIRGGDVIGYALAEDGAGLRSHLSSSEAWSKHDLGVTSDWHHDAYAAHYPDGFELEWVADHETHDAFKAALALNNARDLHGETDDGGLRKERRCRTE